MIRTHSITLTDQAAGRSDSLDTSSVVLLVALAMLVINILPTLQIGFLQDDYRLMDNTQDWGWNLRRAIQQDGYTLGFRPLNMLQHTIAWNLVGEKPLVHRLIRILVHLIFAWMLAYGTRLLGGSRLHMAVVVLLYLASTVTSATIYYWVMFTPADVLSLGALLVLLAGINGIWPARKLALVTLAMAAAAVYTKESGIAASTGLLLLTLCLWNRMTPRHHMWLVGTQFLLLTVYMASYWHFSSNKRTTLSELSLNTLETQAVEVLKGIIISATAPFSAIYLSMRYKGLDVLAALAVVLLAALAVLWLLWTAHGRNLNKTYDALHFRFHLGMVVALLIIIFLIPYLPGGWFETRMLVATFAMGVFFWGVILGDALEASAKAPRLGNHQRQLAWAVGIVVVLAALAAGSPITQNLFQEEQTAQRLRGVVRQLQAQGMRDICLVGFKPNGSLLRVHNAKGVVGYESKRRVSAHVFRTASNIPPTLRCAVVRYDEGMINDIPLIVNWP